MLQRFCSFVLLIGLSLAPAALNLYAEQEASPAPLSPLSILPAADPVCTPILPVTLTDPLIVGDGTAASCSQAALQTALDMGGEIRFNCGSAPTSITLSSELVVSKDTVLDGGGLVTLDGGGATRVLKKEADADLTIQHITIRNGKAPGPSGHFSDETGGGILARGQGTTLTVINSTFENNTVTSIDGSDIAGGAIYAFGLYEAAISGSTFVGNTASNGGAIGVLASGLRIFNSTFANNEAQGFSGGLRGHGGAINMDDVTNGQNPDSNKILHICGSTFSGNRSYTQGGATNSVFSDNVGSRAIIEKSTFENNMTTSPDAGQGGAIFHMEDEHSGGTSEQNFDIINSTFTGNSAYRQGGAVWTLIEGRVSIENATFADNRVADQELGMGGGIAINRGNVSFVHVTLANNYAWFHGGGIQASNEASISLKNTLFFHNESERDWGNYQMNRAADVDGGGNLQFPRERFNQAGTPDDEQVTATVIIADPLLSPLADNGGPTSTMALQEGSPAVDAGNASGCPATDQRGAPRPHGGGCDIGAYESGAVPPDSEPEPEPEPAIWISNGGIGGIGSTFVITGTGFPTTTQQLQILVNGAPLTTTVTPDAAGEIVFLLNTSLVSETGTYQLSVLSDPPVSASFRLVAGGDIHTPPEEYAAAPRAVIPGSLPELQRLYLPTIRR